MVRRVVPTYYSLGADFWYEMLADRPAHDGEDAPSILVKSTDEKRDAAKKIR